MRWCCFNLTVMRFLKCQWSSVNGRLAMIFFIVRILGATGMHFCYVHATLPCLSCKVLFSIGSDRKTQSWLYVVNLGHCISSLPKGLLSLSSSLSLLQSLEQINWLLLFFLLFFLCLLLNYQCYFNAEMVNPYLCMLKPCAFILFK